MWSAPAPQQPPKIRAPAAARSGTKEASSSGVQLYTGPSSSAWQAGGGLGDQGNAGVGGEAAELLQYHLGSVAAVQAKRGDTHALHDDKGGQHIGAGKGASVLVAGKGHKDRLIRNAADGQHRGTGLGHGHAGLDDKEVHPCQLQSQGLLGIDGGQHLKGVIAKGGEGLAGGTQVAGHQRPAVGGFP